MTKIAVVLGNKTREEFAAVFGLIESQINIWNILRYYSESDLQDMHELMFLQLGEKIPSDVWLCIYYFDPVSHDFLNFLWKVNRKRSRLVIKESGGKKAKWHDWTPLAGWKHGAIELLP